MKLKQEEQKVELPSLTEEEHQLEQESRNLQHFYPVLYHRIDILVFSIIPQEPEEVQIKVKRLTAAKYWRVLGFPDTPDR